MVHPYWGIWNHLMTVDYIDPTSTILTLANCRRLNRTPQHAGNDRSDAFCFTPVSATWKGNWICPPTLTSDSTMIDMIAPAVIWPTSSRRPASVAASTWWTWEAPMGRWNGYCDTVAAGLQVLVQGSSWVVIQSAAEWLHVSCMWAAKQIEQADNKISCENSSDCVKGA